MCTTLPVSQALVEVHQGSITVKYMQYVLGVVLLIEFLCQLNTKWYQVPCLCCLALKERAAPSLLSILVIPPKVCIWLVGLCSLYQSFSFAHKLAHLVGDLQVHTVHDANSYHVQCETKASAQWAES